jgi:hypothetical protein
MAREVVEKVIGEHTYKVTLLGAKAGRAMSIRIVKLMGPTLSSFVEGVAGGKGGGEQSLALGASEAVREVALRLTEADCASIMDELAKFTTVALDPAHEPRLFDIFDDHFAGHYDCMLAWVAFALEANFKSFFVGAAGARSLVQKVMTLLSSASPSPPAPTGTSTGSPPASTTAQA